MLRVTNKPFVLNVIMLFLLAMVVGLPMEPRELHLIWLTKTGQNCPILMNLERYGKTQGKAGPDTH